MNKNDPAMTIEPFEQWLLQTKNPYEYPFVPQKLLSYYVLVLLLGKMFKALLQRFNVYSSRLMYQHRKVTDQWMFPTFHAFKKFRR